MVGALKWVVINGLISPLIWVISTATLLITLRITSFDYLADSPKQLEAAFGGPSAENVLQNL